jgi:hypothetical protein
MAHILKRPVITGLMVAAVMAIFAGCSTFPTLELRSTVLTYDILGYVGADFASYDEALAAAKKIYPEVDTVAVVKGKLDNSMISVTRLYGYYAVKFKEADPTAKLNTKFLGLF